MHYRGVLLVAALGNRDKGARAHLAQLFQIEFFIFPVFGLGELLEKVAIKRWGQLVGREHREFACKEISLRFGAQQRRCLCVVSVHGDVSQRLLVRVFFTSFS